MFERIREKIRALLHRDASPEPQEGDAPAPDSEPIVPEADAPEIDLEAMERMVAEGTEFDESYTEQVKEFLRDNPPAEVLDPAEGREQQPDWKAELEDVRREIHILKSLPHEPQIFVPRLVEATEPLWGVAVAPNARTENKTTTAAPAHIIPNLDNEWENTFVYVNPSTAAGVVFDDTLDPLTEATADQYVKVWYRGSGTIQVRATQVVSYIESEGKFWLEGDYTDRPIYTNEMSLQPTVTPNIKPGWHLMDDEADDLHLPSVDADDDGDIFDVHMAIQASVDLRQRVPYGVGNNPNISTGYLASPAHTHEHELLTDESSGGVDPSIELGIFATHYITRIN